MAGWFTWLLLFSPHIQQGAAPSIGQGGHVSTTVPSEDPTPDPTLGFPSSDPGQQLSSTLSSFGQSNYRGFLDFAQRDVIDMLSAYGFMYITPAALSYRNPLVHDGMLWSLIVLDGFFVLLLVFTGYQVLLLQQLGLSERSTLATLFRLLFALAIAHLGFLFFLPQLIELCNLLGMSFLVGIGGSAAGDLQLPLGTLNWAMLPFSWGLFVIIDFIMTIFTFAVSLVRLAVLDLTILTAPVWILCLANESTRSWGRLGLTTFFAALLVQPLQVILIALGSALITNVGHLNPSDPATCGTLSESVRATCVALLGHATGSASTLATLFVGIATMYVAGRIPGMLFSSAIHASLSQVNRDVAQAATAIVRGVSSVITHQAQVNR
jgi:hypothetical protein